VALALWLIIIFASAPALAQQVAPAETALPSEVAAPVDRLTKGIEAAEKAIQHLTQLEEELGRLRIDVESILNDSSETAEQLRPRVAAIRDQIDKLGPPPAKDAPPEAPAIAAERARLNVEAAALDGAIKSAELTWVRARQLILRITDMRHALFTRNLLERQSSPLLPDLWRRVAHEAPIVGHRLRYLGNDWAGWAAQRQQGIGALLAAALLLYLVAKYAIRRVTRRPPREPPPAFVERAVSAAWTAPTRAAPVLLAGLLLYAGLDTFDLLYQPWDGLAAGLIKGLLLCIAIGTLLSTVFAVHEPQWRLFDLSDRSARRICRLLQGVAGVYALDIAFTEMTRSFFMPLAFTILQSLISDLAYVALLVALLLTRFEPAPPRITERLSRHEPRWLKIPLWLIVIGIVAGSLTGYVALARFVAQQLVMTGIVVLITMLLYLAIRALTREPATEGNPLGAMLESRFGLDQPRRHQLARLTELSLGMVLAVCALPVLMLQWGFSGADIRDWFRSLFFGFEIGQFRISLARILIGLVLFTLLLLATRLFQRWLRDRMLQQPRMDPGIANSIDTVVGYTGIAVAALLAVSYAGFDITNLAIVAGALSVGIGFGLQSIVNNFVSGIILLIERPIKVGDWIVVGNEQGNVRRISVRATEIETFDRASLIVPNSELITGRVLNWTHRNLVGRVVLKVAVDYTADPEKVIKILERCADEHPLILKSPPPKASFDGFGASSLDFSLRFLLGDLNRSFDVQSDVRMIVLKALRAEGVNIPAARQTAPPPQNLVLKVRVAYSADPDRVIDILLRSAHVHPAVLQAPAPKAVLEGFGASSLDFALHVAIEDLGQALDVQSVLRTAILKALRAEGIEVPYSQHDIHLRDLDGVRGALARLGDRSATSATQDNGLPGAPRPEQTKR
jgi:small-conductance mechanosensitive channel